MYKKYMLKFYWTTSESNETFYFSTEEEMLGFARQQDVLVEAMFELVEIDKGRILG